MKLTIGWLYPEYMSTYGDRGNIICLTKRSECRNIDVTIKKIDFDIKEKEMEQCDIIVGGGAQDRQQELIVQDLLKKKQTLIKIFKRGVSGLFVCGSPQLLGHYYTTGDGKKLEGLGIFDYITKHAGRDKPRCIGNTIGEIVAPEFSTLKKRTIVGFENHGGRTYLGKNAKPFAKVVKGYGNNGEDGHEGAVYKNVIACYYHGPFLPKNPHVADWLLSRALEIKYGKEVQLEPLDDLLEWQAHKFILQRLGIDHEEKTV